jgi:hypothetical protein
MILIFYSKSIIAENAYHTLPDHHARGPHGIDDVPHGIGGVQCPGPRCKAGVQCRGGGSQYPIPGGGPHGIDGPPNASPHGGDHVGGCPPLGDPPYGIVVDA